MGWRSRRSCREPVAIKGGGRLTFQDLCAHIIELASSAALLAELQGVLSREKFAQQLARRGLTLGAVFDGYAALVMIVTPAVIVPTIIRDPADDQVLATALAAQADLIVLGDAQRST